MKQFFDFTTGKEFNPLKALTTFFISPYNMDNARLLNLQAKVKAYGEYAEEMQWINGIPVQLFPIGVLDLGRAMVKWNDASSGVIQSGRVTVYFTLENPTTLRVTTVICR